MTCSHKGLDTRCGCPGDVVVARADRLAVLDAVIQAEAIARRAVTEHLLMDLSLVTRQGQDDTGNGSDAATTNSELLVQQALTADRARISQWIHKESGHYGQTHWVGKDCFWCDIMQMIVLEEEE